MDVLVGGLFGVVLIMAVSGIVRSGRAFGESMNELTTGEPAQHSVGCGSELLLIGIAVGLLLLAASLGGVL